jgi:hypothetical protein
VIGWSDPVAHPGSVNTAHYGDGSCFPHDLPVDGH